MRSDLLALPALRIAELIRRRELSPVEVVDTHIERIRHVNPALNALVEDRFDEARDEARAAEAAVRTEAALGVLHGVPCTIKEFIAVRGMSWTAGLHVRRGRRAEVDATVVERVRRAGAIVLGVSNVPEGGMWMETYNPIYGRTNNPWDPSRTPGGSSGGEAAIVASGGSPFGIGSDIAGSVRIPAGMCGVIGHKPSELLVPITGHWGDSSAAAERMLCVGPIGRSVADVEALLEVIAGPDHISSACHRLGPAEPAVAAGDLRGVTVIPVTTSGPLRVSAVMRDAVWRAARALAARGATITELSLTTWRELFGRSVGVWLRGLADAGSEVPFSQIITEGEPLALVPELYRIVRGQPRFAAATLGLIALERISGWVETLLGDVPTPAAVQAGLEVVLGPRTVLLHPPYTRTAPKHHGALLTPFDAACTGLFSVTGLPATVVPIGFDPGDLPIAVQIVGRRGADRLTLAVGRVLEDAFGGWSPAPVGSPGT